MAASLLVLAASACQPAAPTHHNASVHGPLLAGAITYGDARNRYLISGDADAFRVAAPATNVGNELRLAITAAASPASVDQQVCTTWDGPVDSIIQPGLVLRARISTTGTRAILISQNIWYYGRENLNVHLVDSTASSPLERLGSFSIASTIGTIEDRRPLPWRFCARAVGAKLQVKAWSVGQAEPSWGDPATTGSFTLPARAPASGQAGAYIGHLQAGEATTFADLAVDPMPASPGNVRWAAARTWAARLLALTQLTAPADAEVDRYAHLVIDGSAPSAAAWAGSTGTSRVRSGAEIRTALLGAAGADPAPVPADAADAYAAALLAGLGGSDQAWISTVYQRALGRAPSSSDLSYWTGALADGRTRTSVAREVVRSSEHRRRVARAAIAEVAGRPATSAEASAAADRLAVLGYDAVRLRADLLVPSAP